MIGMMKTMTNGKMSDSFSDIFDKQKNFQLCILKNKYDSENDIPTDSVKWFSYHTLAMVEELGEVLKSDKRWKTHRNERYVKEEKLDELSDVFITFMNMCMYSGFSSDEIFEATKNKIKTNFSRFNLEK